MSWSPLLYNLAMGAVDAIVLVALSRHRSTRTWRTVGLATTLIALILAVMLGREMFAPMGLAAYGIFVHGTLLFAGSAILLAKAARFAAILSAAVAVILVGVGIDSFWIEPTWLEVTRVRLTTRKLTRPVRIVVLADFQAERFGPYEREVLDRVMGEKPDLILLVGDYFQAEDAAEGALRREVNAYLRRVGFSADLGAVAVAGNVDAPQWPEMFEGLPVRTVDRTASFSVGPVRVTCLGLNDSFRRDMKIANPRPEQYHIVLGHAPDFAMGTIDADLLVAGHTHGGQVRLPLLGSVIPNTSLPRRWACGVSLLPSGAWLAVPRGTGMERGGAPRLRFLCRPELMVIELEPEGRDEG
jgi:predicted MPP superfamily phosphohydrolase